MSKQRLQRRGSMDRAIYERYRENLELLDWSSYYQASIENPKMRFFKQEKQHEMKANKIDTKPNNKRHVDLSNTSITLDAKHSFIKTRTKEV